MSDHSKFGPSAADRWLRCPGSIQLCADLPEPEESKYASEGHMAHALAEKCLIEKSYPLDWIGFNFKTYGLVTQEMAEHVNDYFNYVRSLKGYQEYEQQVSYEDWVPGGFGTSDAIVVDGDTLHVIDLKYGKGIPVNAYENHQGMLYALGALSERDSFQTFEKVVITIHQPRLDNVSHYEITPKELYEWAETVVKPAYLRCVASNPELVPGEKQCRWCKAKAICQAPMKLAEETLMKDFDEMDDHLTPISFLDDSQLRRVLENKAMIIDWMNNIEEHVMNIIMSGQKFDGFKIVHGRSNRKWGNESDAEKILVELLGDKAYVKKVISAAQAEKALGKKDKDKIKDLIVKPDGSPVLVTDSDKRKEVVGITANDFD